MPLGATFDPQYAATGRTAGQFIEGLDAGASLMDRAQARQLRENQEQRAQAQEERQKAEFAAKLPLIKATAQTAVTSAAAAVAVATQREEQLGRAAESSPDYNERYQNILTVPDPQERYDRLAQFQGEISWLKGIPGQSGEKNPYEGFATAVDKSTAESAVTALAHKRLEEQLTRTEVTTGGATDRALINAGTRQGVADTNAAARRDVADTNLRSRVTVASLQGRNAAERAGDSIKHLQGLAAEADQNAADASARGDDKAAELFRETAARYRGGAQKETTFSGQEPLQPAAASAVGGRADRRPAGTASEPPMTVTVPGITSPLPASAAAETPKLYIIDETSQKPVLGPDVKTPQQILEAVRQMEADGALSPDEVRETLTRMGFRPKR